MRRFEFVYMAFRIFFKTEPRFHSSRVLGRWLKITPNPFPRGILMTPVFVEYAVQKNKNDTYKINTHFPQEKNKCAWLSCLHLLLRVCAQKRWGAAGSYEVVRLCVFPFITNYVIKIIDFIVIIVCTYGRVIEGRGTLGPKYAIHNYQYYHKYVYDVYVIKGFIHDFNVVRLLPIHTGCCTLRVVPRDMKSPPASTFQLFTQF